MDYRVDYRDLQFQLFDWLPTGDLLSGGGFGDWDREGVEMALDEALKIARETLAPTNEDGDRIGARLENGVVTVPASFADAYRAVAEGGWIGATNSPDHGGLGLPQTVATAASELICGANLSLGLVFLLTRGVGHLIESHGTDELRAAYCERLYSGRWTGTMCITEPQAGSDVGASTTRAEPLGDGRFRIAGEKIFITWGDHDLTDNVIHAVLARLPDAPPGTRGLSLFLVPKRRLDADGEPGEPNDVICGSIEHKLGIHGSPTCTLLFGANGGCEGRLIGEAHRGMPLMFEMMNAARLEVGLQATAVAGAAHQAALAYARERVQGRHWSRAGDPEAPPVAIVEHPDVRRLLWSSAAYVQAMRALLLRTSKEIDLARAGGGEDAATAAELAGLLTPICKAWCSDWAFRVTEWAMQVFGGYGYIRDYPAEQYLRDTKIASIYEGTNGIQALDLVARKLPAGGGNATRRLLEEAGAAAAALAADADLGGAAKRLSAALESVQRVLAEAPRDDDAPLGMLLNASPLLDMLGHVLSGAHLLEQAAVAGRLLAGRDETGDAEAAFLADKVRIARHFAYRALPHVEAEAQAILSGDRSPIDAAM